MPLMKAEKALVLHKYRIVTCIHCTYPASNSSVPQIRDSQGVACQVRHVHFLLTLTRFHLDSHHPIKMANPIQRQLVIFDFDW